MNGWMHRLMDRQSKREMDGQMDDWMDRQINRERGKKGDRTIERKIDRQLDIYDIYSLFSKGHFKSFQKFNLALLSYFLMDFDLVFGKIREMMRRDKPYQKKLALNTICFRYIAKTMKKGPKMTIF